MTKLVERDNSDADITERSIGFGLKATFISTPEVRAGYREDRDGNDVMEARRTAERTKKA